MWNLPKHGRKGIQAALALDKVVGIVPGRTTRLSILVALALRHLDRRLSGHVRDQQVH